MKTPDDPRGSESSWTLERRPRIHRAPDLIGRLTRQWRNEMKTFAVLIARPRSLPRLLRSRPTRVRERRHDDAIAACGFHGRAQEIGDAGTRARSSDDLDLVALHEQAISCAAFSAPPEIDEEVTDTGSLAGKVSSRPSSSSSSRSSASDPCFCLRCSRSSDFTAGDFFALVGVFGLAISHRPLCDLDNNIVDAVGCASPSQFRRQRRARPR